MMIEEILVKKTFYNRSTNSPAFCALQRMPLQPSLLYATQIINPFLT